MRQWRWEFTRRRPDYREMWRKCGPINEEEILREEAGWRELALQQYGSDDLTPFLDAVSWADPDMLRVRFNMSSLLNPAKQLSDWQLMHDFLPTNPVRQHSRADAMEMAVWISQSDYTGPGALQEAIDKSRRREGLEKDAGVRDYAFDLSRPLAPQLRKAKRHLERIQEELFGKKNTRRLRENLWADHLRVIDARDAHATYEQIADVLSPDEVKDPQWARDRFEAACQLRDNFPI
jgi:hypothetical protein